MHRHHARTAVLAAAALLLTACAGVTQYYEGTGLHDATTAEAVGSWDGEQQAHLTLQQDGSALIERLDGKEWDYDHGWRLSGTGRWELVDRDAGQQLVVDLTTRTGTDARTDNRPGVTPDPSANAAPTTYRWRFYVKRGQQQQLELFTFVGDPDTGNTYLLTRSPNQDPTPAPATAPATVQ
ncbi:hypothetical protein ACFV4P_00510 [Kitasatospora sp. NPDC059795]|uniref:hypothetical protein n=1 Tax=Kitasatospora sp. NPDC059795 TaxID=3346949 RepID=UPI003657F6A7